MDQNQENKKEIKDKLKDFYYSNRLKIYIFITTLLVAALLIMFQKKNLEKKNILISEKYVQAGLYIVAKKNDNALKTLEEIILSGNKFYSILALNTILEKSLISDKNKILEFFEILEKNISIKDHEDLLTLKKALYLIEKSENKDGEELLNNLINKDSKFKLIAQELINK